MRHYDVVKEQNWFDDYLVFHWRSHAREFVFQSDNLSRASAEVILNTMADPLQSPALETPPGVISQFPTTHSGGQVWFRVSATLFTIVPGTLLLLRLYTKLRIVRKVDITDCSGVSPFYCEPQY